MWKSKKPTKRQKADDTAQEEHISAEDDGRKVETKKEMSTSFTSNWPYLRFKKSKEVDDEYTPTSTSKNIVTSPISSKRNSSYDNFPSSGNRPTEGIEMGTTHVPASIASTAQPLCEVNSTSSTRRIRPEKSAEVKSLHVDLHVDPPAPRMQVPTQNDQLSLASQQQSFHQESVLNQKAKVPYNIQLENKFLSLQLSETEGERQQELVPSKVPAVSAIKRKIQSPKGNKGKDGPKEIPKTMHPVGLQNLGNTCFFNAVMQNLNQSFLLYEALDKEGCRLPLTNSMLRFYKQMGSGSSYPVNPREVLSNICQRSPRFAGGRQQDSHELLRHLLVGLRNEERESSTDPNNRKILTSVDKVFGGHFMTVYTCIDCRTPYHVCEPMLDISLPISNEAFQTDEQLKKNKGKSNGQHSATKKCRTEGRSILDCLDVFTRTEHIADEYLCMACHAKRVEQGATDYQMTSAKKRTLIYNPPALLTLHLRRFKQTDYGFTKCNDTISYQDMIDIAPYCSSWCLRNEGKETSIWYSLYGLVVHGGSLDGGHYVAYVKLRETEENIRQFLQESYLDHDQLTEEELVNKVKQMRDLPKPNQKEKWQPQPLKGRWFYVSDSHFSEVSNDEVWRQQAYLLFYERRQGNTVPPNKSMCYHASAGARVP